MLHCYADDTRIYFYCRPSEYAAVKSKVLSCIDAMADWMTINKLHLNPSKWNFYDVLLYVDTIT